ncbi:hypothetical protein CNMCM7691_009310 [Aspergillus felis]|uniref:Extracellular membrane protein CFEM domain-containing protein n=1 Tax=Aspergillus felis TaxID=1287682 RepID=A0A8H6QW48_9EURO|nr:hypothetical protein CNMCM7691_009310 [Aspergillus felis]
MVHASPTTLLALTGLAATATATATASKHTWWDHMKCAAAVAEDADYPTCTSPSKFDCFCAQPFDPARISSAAKDVCKGFGIPTESIHNFICRNDDRDNGYNDVYDHDHYRNCHHAFVYDDDNDRDRYRYPISHPHRLSQPLMRVSAPVPSSSDAAKHNPSVQSKRAYAPGLSPYASSAFVYPPLVTDVPSAVDEESDYDKQLGSRIITEVLMHTSCDCSSSSVAAATAQVTSRLAHLHQSAVPMSTSSSAYAHVHQTAVPVSSSSLASSSSSAHKHLQQNAVPVSSSSSAHAHIHQTVVPVSSSAHAHVHQTVVPVSSSSSAHAHIHLTAIPISPSSSAHKHLHQTVVPVSSSMLAPSSSLAHKQLLQSVVPLSSASLAHANIHQTAIPVSSSSSAYAHVHQTAIPVPPSSSAHAHVHQTVVPIPSSSLAHKQLLQSVVPLSSASLVHENGHQTAIPVPSSSSVHNHLHQTVVPVAPSSSAHAHLHQNAVPVPSSSVSSSSMLIGSHAHGPASVYVSEPVSVPEPTGVDAQSSGYPSRHKTMASSIMVPSASASASPLPSPSAMTFDGGASVGVLMPSSVIVLGLTALMAFFM